MVAQVTRPSRRKVAEGFVFSGPTFEAYAFEEGVAEHAVGFGRPAQIVHARIDQFA